MNDVLTLGFFHLLVLILDIKLRLSLLVLYVFVQFLEVGGEGAPVFLQGMRVRAALFTYFTMVTQYRHGYTQDYSYPFIYNFYFLHLTQSILSFSFIEEAFIYENSSCTK